MEWKISSEPVPYEEAVAVMEERVQAIGQQGAQELVWLLEHPALFTAGTGADAADLLDPLGLPVYATGRGGQYTYHGPGQRIAYVILDLKRRGPDLRQYVRNLESWIIAALRSLGVESFAREGRVGVWVNAASFSPTSTFLHTQGASSEAKIAAIGVRVRRWVSYHGIAINVNPDLGLYRGIVPCGIREYGVTSLAALGNGAGMDEVDRRLREHFDQVFAHA